MEEGLKFSHIFKENMGVPLKKYLMEELQIPDYKADVCTAFAQGNIGKAVMLANSEYFNEINSKN